MIQKTLPGKSIPLHSPELIELDSSVKYLQVSLKIIDHSSGNNKFFEVNLRIWPEPDLIKPLKV